MDWYGHRQVCNNELFPLFFNRALQRADGQYGELLRLETVKADWFVTSYMEAKTENTSDSSSSNTMHNESNGSNTAENTVTTDGTGSHTDTNKSTSTDGNKTLVGENPDSTSYTTGAFPENLDWKYTAGQTEVKNKGTTDSTDTGSETNHNVSSSNGTGTNVSNSDGTNVGKSNLHGEVKTISTGRSQSIAELAKEAKSWIVQSDSMDWLLREIEKAGVFFSIFD